MQLLTTQTWNMSKTYKPLRKTFNVGAEGKHN